MMYEGVVTVLEQALRLVAAGTPIRAAARSTGLSIYMVSKHAAERGVRNKVSPNVRGEGRCAQAANMVESGFEVELAARTVGVRPERVVIELRRRTK
jgi:hypothetical protein